MRRALRKVSQVTRQRGVTAVLTAFLLPVAALVVLASPAQAAPVTASFVKTSTWAGGFTGQYTIKNTGAAPVTSWTVEWDLPSGTTLGGYWSALISGSGKHYTAGNREYNGTLAPGESTKFGFVGSGDGVPTRCRINGGSCDGGPAPEDEPLVGLTAPAGLTGATPNTRPGEAATARRLPGSSTRTMRR